MYDRFTESARQSLATANRIAEQSKHDYISSLSIVLGVLETSPDARALLTATGIDVDRLQKSATEQLPTTFPTGFKRGIEKAMEQARQLDSEVVDAEHILLGALTMPDEAVVKLFQTQCNDIDTIRIYIRSALAGESG